MATTMKSMAALVYSLFMLMSISMSTSVYAVGSCAPCREAGVLQGCALANASCTAGIAMIESALTLSEQALLMSIGMEPNTGLIGFPALASSIAAADATSTRNLVETIDWSAERLAKELRRVPSTQNTMDIERKTGVGAPKYEPEGTAVIERGVDHDIPSPSGLAAALNWRLGAGELSTSKDVEPDDLKQRHSAPSQTSISLLSAPVDQVSKAAIARTLDSIAESSVAPSDIEGGYDFGGLINGGLLLADKHSTLEHGEDFSESSMADYLVQLSVSDTVSPVLALNAKPSSPAQLQALASGQVKDFRFSMIYGVLSRYADMRKPKYEQPVSMEFYKQMSNYTEIPEELSEEGLLELSLLYRSKSAEWREKIATDYLFAARELVTMEADLLDLKYRRWQTKRDLNLLMSQLLAAELR